MNTAAAAEAPPGGDLQNGKKFYLSKCAKCHKLYEPKDYDKESWDLWMEKMRKKARLRDEQYRLIYAYTESLRGD
jgi:mono/diheme cytochrome c family protein